jgi:hypothetical protein
MIWNDSITDDNAPSNQSSHVLPPLARHVAAQIQRTNPGHSCDGGDFLSAELSRSVADFFSLRGNGRLIPADYLLLMTCRALWAVGHEQQARALLRAKGPEYNITETYADVIFSGSLFSCLNESHGFIRGLCSPSTSVLSRHGPYWILNLRTFFALIEGGLEMTVWRVLHALFRQLAALWDDSRGAGTLGLKGLNFVSCKVLGFQRGSKIHTTFTNELIRYCGQDLKITADDRRWRFTPLVISLDSL